MIIQKIIDELHEIPEDHLTQIYEIVRSFRLELERERSHNPDDKIVANFKQGMQEALGGNTIPLDRMWEGIDVD
jgi:predicted KAP-like P-loop ATPase